MQGSDGRAHRPAASHVLPLRTPSNHGIGPAGSGFGIRRQRKLTTAFSPCANNWPRTAICQQSQLARGSVQDFERRGVAAFGRLIDQDAKDWRRAARANSGV